MADWLRCYGNVDGYRWRRKTPHGQDSFCRPLGLTEFSFDADGRYYEGRADMNCQLKVEVRSRLSDVDYRERILLAWTAARCKHLLLQAGTWHDDEDDETTSCAKMGLQFSVPVHQNLSRAVEDAGRHLVFLKDHYDHVDPDDFDVHCQNSARVVDPDVALARVFVLPTVDVRGSSFVRFQFVLGHEIADGLSANVWMRHFIQALNTPINELKRQIEHSIKPDIMRLRLPLPQEALYPPIPGSIARQRWFWAITRILRHVRSQLPVGFENPLRRPRKMEPIAISPVYSAVLDYTRTPPLNTGPVSMHVSAENTQRLHNLVREVKASVGAGIYAMAALTMMEFYEIREPNMPLSYRKAFITGFPLNPRAFFNHTTDPNSMMLAFSDGIALPFLSSALNIEGRLRLLTRSAQRQLSVYQKRAKPKGDDATRQFLSSRGAGLVLANQYLLSVDRADDNLPKELRRGSNVQGGYPARSNPTMQTCGVSSVGNRDLQIKGGEYDLNDISKDFVADFRDMSASVRAREGEFLLGIGGTKEGLWCTPSVDTSCLDPALVERWKDRFEHLLDDETVNSGKSKL